jgi:hypothetical protein
MDSRNELDLRAKSIKISGSDVVFTAATSLSSFLDPEFLWN